MGVVKYMGPVASFHCPTEATIRSLKVHFSPKQEGSGDPSPENVRPIEGWDGVEITHSKKNLFNGIIKVGRDMVGDGTLDGSNTWRTSEPILVKPNTSYTIMHGNALLKSYINIYDNNMNLLNTYTTLSIILTPENAKYITLQRTRSAFESDLKDVAVYETDENIKTNYEFGALGKNKFDKSQYVNGRIMKFNGSNYTADSGYYISPFIPVTVGVSYTKNSPTVDAYHRFATYSSDNVNSFVRVLDTSNTIIIEPGENYIRFCGEITELDTAQLELGSTTTAYEPYKMVYGGWVDLISGEVCEEYGFLTESSGGTLASIVDRNDGYYSIIFNFDTDKRPYSGNGSLCNILNYNSTLTAQNNEYAFYYYLNQQAWKAECRIYSATPLTTVDEAKTYLNQLGFKLAYKLPTPITYSLAPTQLQTFLGQNNVWSNADYIEVEYDLHETQEILNRKAFIMANQPHIESASGAIANFKTDMVAPLKECKVYFSPVQEGEGDPSPENIRLIKGWDSIDITTAGNNIIPINYILAEGKWKPTNGVISGSVYDMGQFLIPKSKLFWSCETKGMPYIGLMDDSITAGAPTYNVITTTNREGYTLDNTAGHKYMLMCCNAEDIINLKQMVNIGTTKTEYSAPSARNIPITFPTEAGTIYGGYVDLVRGEVWETYAKITLSTSNTTVRSGGHYGRYMRTYLTGTKTVNDGGHTISNILPEVLSRQFNDLTCGFYYPSSSQINLYWEHPDCETEEGAESLRSNQDIYFISVLATPILITTLTPTQLKTLRGTNNIWSSANDKIEIKYWKH